MNIKLIILDISGVLCGKDKSVKNKRIKNKKVYTQKFGNCYGTRNYNVYIRPYATEFILQLLKRYDVGIYSSTTTRNISSIFSMILTKCERERLKFIWCRNNCRLDPDYGKDKDIRIASFDTIKDLSLIVSHPVINAKRKYTMDNILAIDDSSLKLRFNKKEMYIIVEPFNLKNSREKEKAIMIKLLSMLDKDYSNKTNIRILSNQNKIEKKKEYISGYDNSITYYHILKLVKNIN